VSAKNRIRWLVRGSLCVGGSFLLLG